MCQSLLPFILIHLEKEGMARKIGDEELKRDYFFIEFEDYIALNYICLKSQLIIILARKRADFLMDE